MAWGLVAAPGRTLQGIARRTTAAPPGRHQLAAIDALWWFCCDEVAVGVMLITQPAARISYAGDDDEAHQSVGPFWLSRGPIRPAKQQEVPMAYPGASASSSEASAGDPKSMS